jgi:hypothetical protein
MDSRGTALGRRPRMNESSASPWSWMTRCRRESSRSAPPRNPPPQSRVNPWSGSASPAVSAPARRAVVPDPEAEFNRLFGALEDWYVDDVRAREYNGSGGSMAGVGGHRILRANKYPGPPWRSEFAAATSRDDLVGQQAIIRAVRDELFGLGHSPSQSGPASGLHRGTREWRLAVASADGSLRTVARRFGTTHTSVRRLRLELAGGSLKP